MIKVLIDVLLRFLFLKERNPKFVKKITLIKADWRLNNAMPSHDRHPLHPAILFYILRVVTLHHYLLI